MQSGPHFAHEAGVARFFRRFGLALAVLFAIFMVLLLSYYLPSTKKVQVTGTEVKRVDAKTKEGTERTRDVRFVVTKEVDGGKTLVFRNEDTGWGWPPYLKFNSGDIMGEAVNFHESDEKETVLVTYYGWRLTFLDLYPNVLSLRAVPADYTHVPVFNIVVITLLIALTVFVVLRVRKLSKRWSQRRAEKIRT